MSEHTVLDKVVSQVYLLISYPKDRAPSECCLASQSLQTQLSELLGLFRIVPRPALCPLVASAHPTLALVSWILCLSL